jgi:xanthine/CO dehydrogenase XdhC/CoxF family maturation factor
MDEREQTAASIAGSASAHGPSDLGARRKDVPTHGTWADARLANIEKREERHEEANRKQEAAQNDDFLTQQHKNNWIQRAQQIRQNIQVLMARQREAERVGAQPAAAANAAPAANTITLDQPVQVRLKYGTATIQPGTTLPVVSHDASGTVVQYMGENVRLPP